MYLARSSRGGERLRWPEAESGSAATNPAFPRLEGKRVLVTGGAGFLGSYLVERLEACGVADLVVPRSREWDLTEQEDVRQLFRQARPDIVFHLAARVGGIGTNQCNPGLFFYANMAIGLNVVEACRRNGLEKVIVAGAACAYPKYTPVPFREAELWNGYPEETNAPYGVAKRALLTMLQAYRQQYGLNGIYLLIANLYGPRDNFDLQSGHVIPALIRKFMTARESGAASVTLWGTGKASRDFLFVEDCAEGLVMAAERYDGPEPVNLGTGQEITIADLAERIRQLVGYRGQIRWDPSRPDGQPRRRLDVNRARDSFGFIARTSLEEGIRRTINRYE